MSIALRLENIRKTIGELALEMNLSVERGELLSLIGPSGCGKSTTLNIISGLLEPDDGRVFIGDGDVTDLPPEKRECAVVFQDYALFPTMDVYHNVAYPLSVRRRNRSYTRQRVGELLELVNLGNFAKRQTGSLSGGEKQRVALARALAASPAVLLLDEPLSALDAQLRLRLRSEIHSIQQTLGQTMVYVTHDREEALAISDRICVMRNGRIEQIGTPQQVYREPANRFVASFMGPGCTIPCELALSCLNTSAFDRTRLPEIPGSGQNTVFFRPEDVSPALPGPLYSRLLFPGCGIIKSEYRGDCWDLTCSYKTALLKARVRRAPTSQTLDLEVRLDNTIVFAGDRRIEPKA